MIKNIFIVMALWFIAAANSYAATASYTDEGSWLEALSGAVVSTENFNDDDLYQGTFNSGGFLPGLTMSGDLEICIDTSEDYCTYTSGNTGELFGFVESGNDININFGKNIFAFSADWNLLLNEAGAGLSIFSGSTLLFQLAGNYDGFFGVISDIAFGDISLKVQGDGSEVFSLDNLSFAEVSPVPVPAAVWLFGSGLFSLMLSNRKRFRTV